MLIHNLWIVMPVYNEEDSVKAVVEEWERALNGLNITYVFCLINDGSKDASLQIMQSLANKNARIHLIDKENSGHGKSCLNGYKIAIENGAEWVLQLDSDGQCDARFFNSFLLQTIHFKCIFGNRIKRDDGLIRHLISKAVSVFTWAATGVWLKDANVPYRLIHTTILKQVMFKMPVDFHLANVLISVFCEKLSPIKWMPIHFRNRMGGEASVKSFSFVKHGITLFRQLRAAMKA